MTTVKQEINSRVVALMKSDTLGSFDPGALGDVLLIELEKVWHDIPDTTRAVLAGVGVELKRHYANGVMSDIQAVQVVNRLRGKRDPT